jgi:tetratricopeptide (TPR) repeat protein
VKNEDFDKQAQEMIHKQMGCSRDHAQELDIYNKPYSEKIKRITLMKEQGNLAMKQISQPPPPKQEGEEEPESEQTLLEKASYFYAQALLIFYYLIPDDDEQETESNALKMSCHLNQSLCFMKMKRFDDSLRESGDVLRIDPANVKALYRKATVLETLGKREEAMNVV